MQEDRDSRYSRIKLHLAPACPIELLWTAGKQPLARFTPVSLGRT